MGIHHHAASILATQGLKGLFRRGAGKVLRTLTGRKHPEALRREAEHQRIAEQTGRDIAEMNRHRSEYRAQVERFNQQVRRRALGDVDGFYWYHTIDLGDGLVTPGDYDYRERLSDYPFPTDMRGRTALDVGSATGFFAFEFERRGADVTSVELPSIADWDLIGSDRAVLLPELLQGHGKSSVAELDRAHVHGPFEFCHRLRGSRVRRCLSRIYDLTPEKLGRDRFDFVFLGDVLGHLFSPLAALNALAPLCSRELVISIDLLETPHAVLGYGGGEERQTDGRSWFRPNWEALRQMLRRVGFKKVERVGQSHVVVRRAWQRMKRDLIRAEK
jgi:tRNA (mo5U34)-methyltransferase